MITQLRVLELLLCFVFFCPCIYFSCFVLYCVSLAMLPEINLNVAVVVVMVMIMIVLIYVMSDKTGSLRYAI